MGEPAVAVRRGVRERLRSGRRFTKGDTIRLGIAIVLLAVGWWLARLSVSGWEKRLFHDINSASDAWYRVLWPIMQLGNILVACSFGLIVGALLRSPRVAIVAVVTPIIAWYAAIPIKHLVDRLRPQGLGLEVTARGGAIHGLGFPSGHATVAWALATMLAPHLVPRLRPVVYVLATLVCVARVYVGAHMPLDVVGGAGLGILIGEIGRWIEVLLRRSEPVLA